MCKSCVCHERGGHYQDAGADRRGERACSSEISSAAQRVYCFGQGEAWVIAMGGMGASLTAAPQFQCIEDSHMQAMAGALPPDDVDPLFFHSGATKRDKRWMLRPATQTRRKDHPGDAFGKVACRCDGRCDLLCGLQGGRCNPFRGCKDGSAVHHRCTTNEYCRTNPALTEANRGWLAGAIFQQSCCKHRTKGMHCDGL